MARSKNNNDKTLINVARNCMRSSNSIRLAVPTENGTFQGGGGGGGRVEPSFNNLPEFIRNCKDYRTFLTFKEIFM